MHWLILEGSEDVEIEGNDMIGGKVSMINLQMRMLFN